MLASTPETKTDGVEVSVSTASWYRRLASAAMFSLWALVILLGGPGEAETATEEDADDEEEEEPVGALAGAATAGAKDVEAAATPEARVEEEFLVCADGDPDFSAQDARKAAYAVLNASLCSFKARPAASPPVDICDKATRASSSSWFDGG